MTTTNKIVRGSLYISSNPLAKAILGASKAKIRNKFTLNRFTGSINVEYKSEDRAVFGKSEGSCKKAEYKLF